MNSKKSTRGTILLVDDSEDFIRAARVLLRGFNIDFAMNGLEALEKIETSPPDILIVDLVMPKMSGLEVIKQVREKFPDIVVVALTAIDEEETLSKCFDMGIKDYMIKGALSSDRLRASIQKLIDELE